jgi:murein DD-endopeptidase MepM/ murein hydrolase activator NlpD
MTRGSRCVALALRLHNAGAEDQMTRAAHVVGCLMTLSVSMAFLPSMGCIADVDGVTEDTDLPGIDEPRVDDRMSFSSAAVKVGGEARVVNTGHLGLRLRSGPGLDHAILTVMPEGDTIKVTGGPSSGWYRGTHSGETGWCYGAYLAPVSSGQQGAVDSSASAAVSSHALLPWRAGKTFYVSQGHWSSFSHSGMSGWAWDFATPSGTAIVAVRDGKVRRVKGNSTSGACSKAYSAYANYVVIDHHDGTESLYLHLSSTAVSAGAKVSRGQLIGKSGATGWSCGAHLHFQLQKSPSGGGTTSYFNQSVHGTFYDTGHALDPKAGTYVTSKNGSYSTLSNDGSDLGPNLGPAEPSGFTSTDAGWDQAMQEADTTP